MTGKTVLNYQNRLSREIFMYILFEEYYRTVISILDEFLNISGP